MNTALWIIAVLLALTIGLQVGVYLGQWKANR
jgi:uncharacterized protein YneF (UPF0154 family)